SIGRRFSPLAEGRRRSAARAEPGWPSPEPRDRPMSSPRSSLGMSNDPLTRPQEENAASAARAPSATRELGTLLQPEVAPPPASAPSTPSTAPLPSAARASAPSAHAAFLARRHFAALDGLRALAMLVVVWHHTVGGPGHFGANLFFLLSGFLVTTLL